MTCTALIRPAAQVEPAARRRRLGPSVTKWLMDVPVEQEARRPAQVSYSRPATVRLTEDDSSEADCSRKDASMSRSQGLLFSRPLQAHRPRYAATSA